MELKAEDLVASFQQQAETFLDFLSLIPWHEKWLIGVMMFHGMCLPCVIFTKNHYNLQYLLFFLLLVLVYMAENINTYAATHWKSFSQENYFDSNGLFISTVFSAPILFNCLVLIVVWLFTAGKLLVGIKRSEISRLNKNKKKKEEKEEEDDEGEGEQDEETKKAK